MRTAFIEQLILEARDNPRIFLVVGDLGYSVVEPFSAEFPDRYLNVGVAEQNMTGLAAGLAAEGYHVFTYSIGNFPTLRCLEQIRNDICYHRLAVTVVAVGAGMTYGNLGFSHHCVQDIGCLRGMPGLTLLSPADPGETRACVRWLAEHPGPSYLRLGKAGEPTVHSLLPDFRSPLRVFGNGGLNAVVGTGSILFEALAASRQLASEGLAFDVLSLTKLSPIDTKDLHILHTYHNVLTVEEHVRAGGIGELLQGLLPRTISVRSLSLLNESSSTVGSQSFLRTANGLDVVGLMTAMREMATNERPQFGA